MNVLIIYAHPNERSFNHAMKEEAVNVLKNNGHSVQVSGLYEMKFKAIADQSDFTVLTDPNHFHYLFEQKQASIKGTFSEDIQLEQAKVTWADLLIFQFPLWWTEPPAILKGWFDRVFSKGFAYDNDMVYEKGLLIGKNAMLAFTTAGGQDNYGKGALKGEMHERLFSWHHEKLFYCGLNILAPFIAWDVYQDEMTRAHYLSDYANRLTHITDELPISPREKWLRK